MPVDKQENPIVDLKYIMKKDDLVGSDFIEVSFDSLTKMNKEAEWRKLYQRIEKSNVIIRDDVNIENAEIVPYKEFYLKTYFYNLSRKCKSCVIMK
jgi:hypothetical protein